MWETKVQSLGQEDPLGKEMATTPIFLPGESHEQRSLADYSPWSCKESDTTEHARTHTQDFVLNAKICTILPPLNSKGKCFYTWKWFFLCGVPEPETSKEKELHMYH